jgi:hypothetical protein
MTSENASDLESTDNISALDNTISRESRRIRRMPTPLMKVGFYKLQKFTGLTTRGNLLPDKLECQKFFCQLNF